MITQLLHVLARMAEGICVWESTHFLSVYLHPKKNCPITNLTSELHNSLENLLDELKQCEGNINLAMSPIKYFLIFNHFYRIYSLCNHPIF